MQTPLQDTLLIPRFLSPLRVLLSLRIPHLRTMASIHIACLSFFPPVHLLAVLLHPATLYDYLAFEYCTRPADLEVLPAVCNELYTVQW